jgi:hypothetical protein
MREGTACKIASRVPGAAERNPINAGCRIAAAP